MAFAGPLFSFLLANTVRRGRLGRGQTEQRGGQFHGRRLGGPGRSGVEGGPASGRHDSGNGRPSGEKFSAHGVARTASNGASSPAPARTSPSNTVARRPGEYGLTQCRSKCRRNGMNARRCGRFSSMPRSKPMIDEVASNSPAAVAGLKPGDEIVALDGQKIYQLLRHPVCRAGDDQRKRQPVTLHGQARRRNQFDRLLAVKPLSRRTPGRPSASWRGRATRTSRWFIPSPVANPASAGQIFSTFRALFSHNGDRRPAARRRGDDHPRL